ncbi:hypothetical protein M0R45_009214 [Rubus argutus]|uniref:Uncharacterized protein n=1 Tax=Rubus argutus TaxID=59490 RepID=A0AAW1Y4C5_RUBAR
MILSSPIFKEPTTSMIKKQKIEPTAQQQKVLFTSSGIAYPHHPRSQHPPDAAAINRSSQIYGNNLLRSQTAHLEYQLTSPLQTAQIFQEATAAYTHS